LVRLQNLLVRNFKKLRFDASIEFNDGITLIAGLNESGKSSMLDAILFALFGRVIRPLKARNEDLISYGASEATITLVFEIEDRRFQVTRHLYRSKPTRANLDEITPNGSLQPIATGQEKVNDEIVNLLGGITYHEIISSTVVAQKDLDRIIELNKDDRRRIINAFLNLESFNTVTTNLSEERRELEGTGTRIGRIQAATEKLALLRQGLDQFNKSATEKLELEHQNTILTEDLETLQTKYQEQDALCKTLSSYDTVTRNKEKLSLQLTSKKQIYQDQSTRTERLHREAENMQKELARFAAYDEAEPFLERIKIQLEKTRAASLELSIAERSLQKAQKDLSTAQSTPESKTSRITANQAKQAEKPILPYLFTSALLLIGGFAALTINIIPIALVLIAFGFIVLALAILRVKAATTLIRQQSMLGELRYLNEKQQDLVSAEQRRLQADEQLKVAVKELENLSNSILAYKEVRAPKNLEAIQAMQRLLEAAQDDRMRKNALQEKLGMIRGELEKVIPESELVDLKRQIESMERELNQLVLPELPAGISFSPQLFSNELVERDAIGRKIAALQSKIEQNSQRINNLSKYLTENADIAAKVQSQEELVKKFEHQLKVTRMAIEGIQATAEALRTRIRPSVQSHMASILPALTSSRYKAAILDENYALQVWDPEAGEYRPRDVYSGGTEDQFLLALRLAFALALLPEVKGRKPEFVFLDEPLGSSDDIRRSGIVEYLRSDLSRKFKQIFIISHVGGLEEQVQNTIMLDDGRVL